MTLTPKVERVVKAKVQVLGIAPLNQTQQFQRRFYNRGSGVWLALAIVPWHKLAALVGRATDFGPAVMLPAGILCPNQPC